MSRVGGAVEEASKRLPVTLRELHTDSSGKFINHSLHDWCQRRDVRFTRGRGYKKNDQAYVEQRNWLAVRRRVGHDRYRSKAALAALRQLYMLTRLQLNFLRPVPKLTGKERSGASVRKLYDAPRTPYQRLLAWRAWRSRGHASRGPVPRHQPGTQRAGSHASRTASMRSSPVARPTGRRS